jgi:hypothetical protein
MSREQFLEETQQRLEKELTEPMATAGLLRPGDTITITITIQRQSIVTVEMVGDAGILALTVEQFFTRERCQQAGVGFLGRFQYVIDLRGTMTMAEFVKLKWRDLNYRRRVGRSTMFYMRKVLRHFGYDLQGDIV